MALVEVSAGEEPGPKEVNYVLAALRQGEPVCLPTRFGYIFACDAINRFAIRRLRELRNDRNPTGYAVLFCDISQFETFTPPLSSQVRRVLDVYWSQLLTYRAPKKDLSWDSGDDCRDSYFFARSSSEPFIQQILKSYGPLAISSASAKGWPSFSSPKLIDEQFSGRVQTVIGVGDIVQIGKSTVISELDNGFIVLREGAIDYLTLVENFPDIKFTLSSEMRDNV